MNNKTDKISCLIESSVNHGYNVSEVIFITSYFIKNGFYSIIEVEDITTNRYDASIYLDDLSLEFVDKFNICVDALLSSNIALDVLKLVYSEYELKVLTPISIMELLDITTSINWTHIKNFNSTVEVLKKALLNIILSMDVEDINKLLKQHYSIFNNRNIECDLIFKHNNSYFVTFNFSEYIKVDSIGSYVEDIIMSLEYEDIQLIIDIIL